MNDIVIGKWSGKYVLMQKCNKIKWIYKQFGTLKELCEWLSEVEE